MGRTAWLAAFAISLAIHVAFAISLHPLSADDIAATDDKSVSVAGSLSGILGSSAPVAAAPAEPMKAVRTSKVGEATRRRPLEPVRDAKPVSATRAPLTARAETLNPVAPVSPEKAEPVDRIEQASLADPQKAAPVDAVKPRAVPKTRPSKAQPPVVQRQRASSASKKAMKAFARKIARALARSRPKRVAGSGTVVIAFTLSQRGGLTALRVQKSSGNARIDRAARRAVRRTRFPKPPQGASRKQRSFVVPYYFRK